MPCKLTDRKVRSLTNPDTKYRITYDTEISGFGIRVTKSGTKSFILNYAAQGRERRFTIGKYPAWSVAAARNEASRLRQVVDVGGDPMAERNARHEAPTMKSLCSRYLDEYVRPRKRAVKHDESLISNYIKPALGGCKVASVSYGDVDKLHREISKHAPVQANHVVAVLSKMFSLSVKWGYRQNNPTHGIEKNPEDKRERYLSGDEMARLLETLADYPYVEKVRVSRAKAIKQGSKTEFRRRQSPHLGKLQSANIIRLLMLTGARRSEVMQATWSQFDLSNGTWTKPSAHTKQKKLHTVPLSAPARQLLAGIAHESEYVFPGPNGHQTEIKRAWASICKMADLHDVRVHDLRHTYASQLVSAGLSLPVIGALLGHSQPGTTARYAHLMDDPLREATERVGALVSEAEDG